MNAHGVVAVVEDLLSIPTADSESGSGGGAIEAPAHAPGPLSARCSVVLREAANAIDEALSTASRDKSSSSSGTRLWRTMAVSRGEVDSRAWFRFGVTLVRFHPHWPHLVLCAGKEGCHVLVLTDSVNAQRRRPAGSTSVASPGRSALSALALSTK